MTEWLKNDNKNNYTLSSAPETEDTLEQIKHGEILEAIMHKSRMTYLIILMFFFVGVWFQISFFSLGKY